jgi:hypothetical protein
MVDIDNVPEGESSKPEAPIGAERVKPLDLRTLASWRRWMAKSAGEEYDKLAAKEGLRLSLETKKPTPRPLKGIERDKAALAVAKTVNEGHVIDTFGKIRNIHAAELDDRKLRSALRRAVDLHLIRRDGKRYLPR